jgi:hypothetical protein
MSYEHKYSVINCNLFVYWKRSWKKFIPIPFSIFLDKNLHDLNCLMVNLTRKSKMIKSPIWMYKNGHNLSVLMLWNSGFETNILRPSTCVFCRQRIKTLLNWSVGDGNRRGMYMHACMQFLGAESWKAIILSFVWTYFGNRKVITMFKRPQHCAYC